jgi:hypothetical protein
MNGITKEQNEKMIELATPLMRWLADNCRPHCAVFVGRNFVELAESIALNPDVNPGVEATMPNKAGMPKEGE